MTHNLTRTLILAGCSAAISMLTLSASPNPPACVNGDSLANYEALTGGCTIGDKLFSNFGYSSSAVNSTAIPVGGVTVDTIAGPDIGLQFSAGWTAGQGEILDSVITFSVKVVGGGGFLIEDAGLAQGSNFVDTGSASVIESGCISDGCDPLSQQWGLITVDKNGLVKTTDHTFFAPTGFVNVAKDITVKGGSAVDGFAHLSIVRDTFSQIATPEPKSLSLLLGLGLVLGGVFRKKFQSARA